MTKRHEVAHNALKQLDANFTGQMGVAAIGSGTLHTLPPLLWRAADSFPPASIIKVPILFTALRQYDQGLLSLDDKITLTADEQVLGSGVLRDMEPGLQLTIRDLLTLMIIVSDNTATNMMIDRVGGPDQVNGDLELLGLADTYLSGKLMLPPERRNAVQRAGRVSATTPRDMTRLLELMIEGDALTPASRQVAQSIMLRQHDLDSLTRHLPWPKSEPIAPWAIAAKSGSIQGVRNQIGWITYSGRHFFFAILTKGCSDLRYFGENEGKKIVAKAFKIAFDYFFETH